MDTKQDLLVQQIQRLLIEDADKQRLLEEIKQVSEDKQQHLAELIVEHDKEALHVLDQKAEELEQNKGPLNALRPDQENTDEEVQSVIQDLKAAMKDPQRFAKLLAESDDLMLKHIEEIIAAGLTHSPKMEQECHQLFQEVRLQKAAFIEEGEAQQKELLKEAIISRKGQIDRLDVLIGKAEKMLGKKYEKA